MTPQTQITEDHRKSLELLQGIITRLSTNGFLLKGWTVTLVTALLTFTGTSGKENLAQLAYLPAGVFWILDAYLLAREQQYRQKFESTRKAEAEPYDFKLPNLAISSWLMACVRPIMLLFYVALITVIFFLTKKIK